MIILGDLHGDFETANSVATKFPERTIYQVGDFGIFTEKDLEYKLFPNIKFIRGNHDNPDLCKKSPNYLGDFGYDEKNKLMWISGAKSLSSDRSKRTPGFDCWPDEELSIKILQEVYELYLIKKPDIVISHDCTLAGLSQIRLSTEESISNTVLCFDKMFRMWKPQYWYYGHYHKTRRSIVDGCTFCCVGPSVYLRHI